MQSCKKIKAMTDITNEIIQKIYAIYKQKGFVDENTVFNLIIDAGIPLDETDRVVERLLSMGVLIQDKPAETVPQTTDDESDIDRTQLDYEEIYSQVLKTDPSLALMIDYVRQIPAPKTREISNLMVQAKAGNSYARKRIIELMMKVAIKMALNYSERYHTELDDTIQYALEGLVIAYEKYEIGRQDNFTTYAPWWIRQNLDRTIDICSGIHTPAHVDEEIKQVSELVDAHFCDCCVQSDICKNLIAEICEKVNIDEEKAKIYMQLLSPNISIEELVENEAEPVNDDFYEDMIDNISYNELRENIRYVLSTLSSKEEKILIARYGLDDGREKTLEEVGNDFNVTRERIRQIESKALKKLHHPSRLKKLKDYFGYSVDISEESENKKKSKEKTYAETKKSKEKEDYEEYTEIEEINDTVNILTQTAIQKENEHEYSIERVNELEALANECDIDAMLDLADMYYFNGYDEKALYWYETAAEFEDADGMYCTGIMYRDGRGTKQDYDKALKFFMDAAEQDHPGATNEVGVYYHNQKNMHGKYTKAIIWYRKAADLGDMHAQCNLGWYYEYGLGCESNLTLAKKYYELSAAQGCKDAIKYLKRINKKI